MEVVARDISDHGGGIVTEAGFGVYVHWPFCRSLCPYCDFNVRLMRSVDPGLWRDAYLADIRHHASRLPGRRVDSIYFGGGTPSLMDPAIVDAVIAGIAAAWSVDSRTEISLEANPSSVEAGRFAEFAAAGVNRISIGVQSLRDADLKRLGRRHTAAMARDAVDTARKHVPAVNIDLIYARPNQTVTAWEGELREALALGADHLSLYQLTIKPGTRFGDLADRGRLPGLPGEALEAALYEATATLAAASGYPAYEISSHARPGSECTHNLVYWRYGEFAGIGPGADGRIVLSDGVHPTTAIRDPGHWLDAVRTTGSGTRSLGSLTPDSLAEEYLIASLRLAEGSDLDRLQAFLCGDSGLHPEQHRERRFGRLSRAVDELVAAGILERGGPRIAATAAGRLVLDSVLRELCDPRPAARP